MPTNSERADHRLRPYRIVLVPLVAGLVCALSLAEPELRFHDEGHFLLAANTIARGIGGMLSGVPLGEIQRELEASGGTLYFTGKPGYVGLLAVAGLVTGALTIVKALALGSLLFVLGAALLGSLVARIRSERAGLVAGLLFALTPTAGLYAATALGLSASVCFMMLALWLLASREECGAWRTAASGACAAVAISCHYNAGPVLAAAALGLLPRLDRRHIIWGLGSTLLAILLIQAASMGADAALAGTYPEFQSWFGELRGAFFDHQVAASPGAEIAGGERDGARGYGVAGLMELGRIGVLGLQGSLVIAVAGLGAAVCARARGDAPRVDWFLAAWGLLPVALWSLYPWKVERAFFCAIPGLAAFGAVAIDAALGSGRGGARVLLAGVLVAGLLTTALRLERDRVPISRVVEDNLGFLARQPPGAITGASLHWRYGPIWKWNLGNERINRGAPLAGVDFSGTGLPRLVAADPSCGVPDPDYAGQNPAFGNARPVGTTGSDRRGAWGFLASAEP